jgi:hypothetical protein
VSSGARELGLDFEQPVGDRHRRARARARRERVHLADGVVDDERNALDASLLEWWKRCDEFVQDALRFGSQEPELDAIDQLAMDRELIPPTRGHTNPDPELAPLDLVVGEPRSWTPGPTLSNSFGFGGHNGCLVIAPPPTA